MRRSGWRSSARISRRARCGSRCTCNHSTPAASGSGEAWRRICSSGDYACLPAQRLPNRTYSAWSAYSQSKLGQRADALATLGDLQKQFAASRWIRDAKALEVEVRQASGQTVPPDQNDEEVKLMALRGIMQSDPDQAMPIIEKMLAGASSPKVKDRALFVLSQSHVARARDIIAGVAKGNANPDLQLRAIRYIGIMGGPDNRQILADGSNTRPLVIVDHRGKSALDAAAYFMGHGLQNVRCLRGGIDAWALEVETGMRRYKLE